MKSILYLVLPVAAALLLGAAASRLRAASTSAIQDGVCKPCPTATRQPMRLRTMWCRKALPSKSKRQ